MRKWFSRIGVITAIAIAGVLSRNVEGFNNVVDEDKVEKRFRALAQSEGAPEIDIVWHHSATSKDVSYKRLCEITNERFGLGCAYFLSVHADGSVYMLNDADEHTPSVGGRNSKVLSVVFVGNFDTEPMPEIMLDRAEQIKKAFDELDENNDEFKIGGYYYHSDFKNTACPGKYAKAQLKQRGLIDR